jgi:hypothetical protein
MRGTFLLLLLSTACTQMPRKSARTSAYPSTCSLFPITGVNLATTTRAAERDFVQQKGYPYALFYRETHAGAPNYSRCIRLVQQAENRFAYYEYDEYGHQGVKSRVVTNPTWGQSLAHVGRGHFMGACTNEGSEPVEGVLLVKYDSTVVFSLVFSLREQEYFTGLDKLRVDAARQLIQRVVDRKP